MKTLLDIAVPAITVVVMLAIGMALMPRDFDRVRRYPKVLITGLVAPPIVLPPLALLLLALFEPMPSVQVGLLLIAACPIGGISNTYSYLAGASLALSIALTACSSVLAVVTVPLIGEIFGLVLSRPFGLDAPMPPILAQLLLMLAAPVGVGMYVRQRRPALAERAQPMLKAAGFGALGLLIVLVIASAPAAFVDGLADTVPLAAAFVVGSFAVGWAIGIAVTASSRDRFTLASEFATRNVAVATAIAVTLAGRVEFAFFATTYFLTEMPLMLGAIAVFRSRSAVGADPTARRSTSR